MRRLSLVGLSYGGFVAYSMAAQSMEEGAAVAVERVVICCAAVCIEEREIKEGMLSVSDLEQAAGILVPQTPARLRELMSYTLSRHPPLGLIPSCLLSDFIDAMCADYIEQKRDLVREIPRNRKVSEIPKITQPTLIIWGEHDHIFPVELGHRLKRHIGDNAHLVVIKDTGHAFNMEKPKEFHKLLKMFLVDRQPPPASSSPDYESEKCTTEERTSDNGSDPKTKATASTNAPSQA